MTDYGKISTENAGRLAETVARVERMTVARAKETLRPLGVSLRSRDGEYRVNPLGGVEATAYYTDDLTDAVNTGRMMAQGVIRG